MATASTTGFKGGRTLPTSPSYKSPWLHALYDKMASIRAHDASCVLVDVEGKGEGSFVVADYERKLRVFKGTRQTAEAPLPDSPTAACTFYTDESKPRVPVIAVASGPSLYVFRRLRPDCKYTVPAVPLDETEAKIWARAKKGESTAADVKAALSAAADQGAALSARSLAMLPMEGQAQLDAHFAKVTRLPFQNESLITCLASTFKSSEEPDSKGLPVLGTETKKLIFLDSTAKSMLLELALPAVPTVLTASGRYDVDWRVAVACRDGCVYAASIGDRRGTAVLRKPHIEVRSPVVGMCRADKFLVVGHQKTLTYYLAAKNRRVDAVEQPARITGVSSVVVRKQRYFTAVVVALATGDLRIYRDQQLVDVLKIGEGVVAVAGGVYGREENSLVVATKSGSLIIKMLPRSAQLDPPSVKAGPPPEQDVPLPIPKKPKSYLDVIKAEKDHGPDRYRAYRRDLLEITIDTYKTYLKNVQTGQVGDVLPVGHDAGLAVDLKVKGLGPVFNLHLQLTASGTQVLRAIPIALTFDPRSIYAPYPATTVPVLVPGLDTPVVFRVKALRDDFNSIPPVTVTVLHPNRNKSQPLFVADVLLASVATPYD